MCSLIFLGVDTHAHVDPGYKLVTRSLKIYAALDYSVGIFWVRHAHTTGDGIFWGPSVGNWAYFEVATGVGACPSGPLSGQLHALSPGPALPPYKGRGSADWGPPPLVHRPPAKASAQYFFCFDKLHTWLKKTLIPKSFFSVKFSLFEISHFTPSAQIVPALLMSLN